MNVRSFKSVLVGLTVVLTLMFFVQGCGNEEPAADQSSAQMDSHDHDHSDSADHMHGGMTTAANDMAKTAEATVAAGEQTTCPVMAGNPIDKSIFVEHEGKKVYFCCQGCVATFKADPEKYMAKLPQFQDE